jgi:hypothetical protein
VSRVAVLRLSTAWTLLLVLLATLAAGPAPAVAQDVGGLDPRPSAGPTVTTRDVTTRVTLPAGAALAQATTTAQPEVTAAQAGAGVLLSAEDRVELAQALAEATEESEICFGYLARLNDSGTVRQDAVSSLGPNQRVTTSDPRCPKGGVELQVDVEYTCGSCESDDRAS